MLDNLPNEIKSIVVEKSDIQNFIDKIFEAFDVNKDERVSFEEFCEFIKLSAKDAKLSPEGIFYFKFLTYIFFIHKIKNNKKT